MEDRVSRTQFQYSLEDPNSAELATFTRKMVQELSKEPIVTDVASDLQDDGLGAQLVIDRDTAARLGVAMADVDNTLYDAFRTAPDLNHLYAAQPVPRGDGGREELPDRSRHAQQSLRQVCERHRRFRSARWPIGSSLARNWRSDIKGNSRQPSSASTSPRAKRWAMP